MTTRRPDAFEKMIVPMLGSRDLIGRNGKYLSSEVAKLLRAQHAKVMELVKAQTVYQAGEGESWLAIDKDDLLAALDRMTQGGGKR